MLRIRLTRRGAKKDPHYRVVVTEKRSPRDGQFVEIVGHYSPAMKPVGLQLKLDRIDHWVRNGAQPSATVGTLVRKFREQQEKSVPEEPEKPERQEQSEQSEQQEVQEAQEP